WFADLERGIDWRRVVGAVRHFKWLILSVTSPATPSEVTERSRHFTWLLLPVTSLGVAGALVASRCAKPAYLAQASIWIDQADRDQNRRDVDRGPIRQGHLLEPEAWVDLLQSYVVLDQVVRDQRLFLTVPLPADTAVVAGLAVAERYRPGRYRLTVDSAGRGYTLANADGLKLGRGGVGDSIG